MTDYEKFKQIYDEIDELLRNEVTSEDSEFITWKTKAERFIRRKYGDGPEYKSFSNTAFTVVVFTFHDTVSDYIEACASGLKETKAKFKVYLDEMEDEEMVSANEKTVNKHCNLDYSKIFVVHGHDGEIREAIARLLEKQNITPIILNEQANQGKTIIEKFEKYSDVTCAICLFTSDDQGKANSETDYKNRARQNVVFEAGYFIGKLGRENVILVADENVEVPSDMSGMVYSNRNEWRFSVLKELKAMGFSIDYNKLD